MLLQMTRSHPFLWLHTIPVTLFVCVCVCVCVCTHACMCEYAYAKCIDTYIAYKYLQRHI